MNMPIKPSLLIEGDSSNRIMSRSGELIGLSKTRAVWRYGFLPDSDAHKAYGVSTPEFYWAIAKHNGDVLETFTGYAFQLPDRFKAILNARL